MQKAILISIRPEWVEKILNGEKTIEIRKSMPKCELPIDVYIYCSKDDMNLYKYYRNKISGDVTESFNDGWIVTKDNLSGEWTTGFFNIFYHKLNAKVVAKFTLNKVSDVLKNYKYKSNGKTYVNYISNCGEINWCQKACLSPLELENYLSLKNGYAWHIENLQIFDKHMELSEFYKGNYEYIRDYVDCNNTNCPYVRDNSILGDDGNCDDCPRLKVNKAPQSWQYVYIGD
jgi:hypothetical protein